MKATTEKAFETYIQETLSTKGWSTGTPDLWDKQNALFPEYAISFIQTTQPTKWAEMQKLHGPELIPKLIENILKERNLKGTLNILRHGFKFHGQTFDLAYFKPAHCLNPDTLNLYNQNLLHITRQIPCHPQDTKTIDIVLSINGIPVATIELKNPGTNQTWKNAIAQYKTDRDPRAPLFQFKKGALVHFAIDSQEIYMCTRLNNERSFFLPFNRGSNPGETTCGKGNPPHPSGHNTGYFWEETLERDSFFDIVGNFIFLETKEEIITDKSNERKKITKETMIFPRFHQLDAVRKLIDTAREEQSGHYYLIQHSAGSGKTNSISWLSHRLANLHTSTDEKIFNCVIVITDRKVLDKQLQDAVYQIEHKRGVVQAIDDNSTQLAGSLIDGTPIVITTLQKFPFILKGLLHIAGAADIDDPNEIARTKTREWQTQIAARNYAIIVDEAHSSQSGDTAVSLRTILGTTTKKENPNEEPDWEDNFNQIMESRKKQKNLSFFAFTATPKGKTLAIFGRPDASGKNRPFHTYSMKQAIEEGFILDVLQHYTTYKTYYNLIKKIDDDPNMPEKKATKKLLKFLSLHPVNINQKTEIIIEHFRSQVKHKLDGRAKAMVVTGSRQEVVTYMLSFREYIKEKQYTDIRPLVAFSGTVKLDNGNEYTEPSMNIDVITGKPISEIQLPDRFKTMDYQLLLVADKYQTGFDQPLLYAMYVDKRLDGVQAVQTLSRLNRTYPGKESPFILDFKNEHQGIKDAFQPFYTITELEENPDPYLLEELKHELDAMYVYDWQEVEAFTKIFYTPHDKQNAKDHARLGKEIQPSIERFKELDEEHRTAFYKKLNAYTRFYLFISQILSFSDKEHEMLYSFGRYLLRHLHIGEDGIDPHPENDVYLESYRIEKTSSGSILLQETPEYGVKAPTAVGTGKSKDEEKPLSEIIKELNERFGTDFTEADRLLFEQIKTKACSDEKIIRTAQSNSLDKFELGIQQEVKRLILQRMNENDKIVTRYMDDPEFQRVIFGILAREIYFEIKKARL